MKNNFSIYFWLTISFIYLILSLIIIFQIKSIPNKQHCSTQPIALVTGNNRGLGNSLTQSLHNRGYYVLNFNSKICNLRKTKSIVSYIEKLKIQGIPGIQLLINNAAIIPNFLHNWSKRFIDTQLINALHPYLLVSLLSRNKLLHPACKIINISSTNGQLSSMHKTKCTAKTHPYSLSKVTLNGVSQLFCSMGFYSISVHPGLIDTRLTKHNPHKKQTANDCSQLICKMFIDQTVDPGYFYNRFGNKINW